MSPIGCRSPFAVLAMGVVLSGCGRGTGAASSRTAASGSAAAVPAGGAPPARDTFPFDESLVVKPALRYGSFRVAADSLRGIVTRSLGVYADSAVWERTSIEFEYRDSVQVLTARDGASMWVLGIRNAPRVTGLRMSLAVKNSHGFDAEQVILGGLRTAGWEEEGQYSADGPDGSILALVCEEAIGRYQASWDGGDDSDSTYVPDPGTSIRLECVPRSPVRRGPLVKSR